FRRPRWSRRGLRCPERGRELGARQRERTCVYRRLRALIEGGRMTREDVDRWLDAYIDASATYDRERILGLFSDDVEYRYHPYDQPVRGRDAVADVWLGEATHQGASARDEPGTFEAVYRAVAVEGD